MKNETTMTLAKFHSHMTELNAKIASMQAAGATRGQLRHYRTELQQIAEAYNILKRRAA